MSFGPAVILPTLFLKNSDSARSPLFHDTAADAGVVDRGRSEFVPAVSGKEQNLPKRDDRSNITFEVFNLEDFSRTGAILLPSGFNYCIHSGGFDSV